MISVTMLTMIAKDWCLKALSELSLYDDEEKIDNAEIIKRVDQFMRPPGARIRREDANTIKITMQQYGIPRIHRYWLADLPSFEEYEAARPDADFHEKVMNSAPEWIAGEFIVEETASENRKNKVMIDHRIAFAALEGWDVPLAPTDTTTHCRDVRKAMKKMLKESPEAVEFSTDVRNPALIALAIHKHQDYESFMQVRYEELKEARLLCKAEDKDDDYPWTEWAINLRSSKDKCLDEPKQVYRIDSLTAAKLLSVKTIAGRVMEYPIVMKAAPVAMTVGQLRPIGSPPLKYSARHLDILANDKIGEGRTEGEKVNICQNIVRKVDALYHQNFTAKGRHQQVSAVWYHAMYTWVPFVKHLFWMLYVGFPYGQDTLNTTSAEFKRTNGRIPYLDQLYQFVGQDPEKMTTNLQKPPFILDQSLQ